MYGILAAPPCDHFAGAGARWWKEKDLDGRTVQGLKLAYKALEVIEYFNPTFWALENPVGRLTRYIGKYKLLFNPCDYGDAYTKKTCLWGKFNEPIKNQVEPEPNDKQQNRISQPIYNGKKVAWNSAICKELRSITPPGFAQAFYEVNK